MGGGTENKVRVLNEEGRGLGGLSLYVATASARKFIYNLFSYLSFVHLQSDQKRLQGFSEAREHQQVLTSSNGGSLSQ